MFAKERFRWPLFSLYQNIHDREQNKRVIDLNMLQEAFLAFVKAVPLIVLGATIFALSVYFLILGLKKIIQ